MADVSEKLDRILIGIRELKAKISKIEHNMKAFDSRLTAVEKKKVEKKQLKKLKQN